MMDSIWSIVFIGNIACIAANLLLIQDDLRRRSYRLWAYPWLLVLGHSAFAGIAAIQLGIW